MKINRYLAIEKSRRGGSARITTQPPNLKRNEIAVLLNLDIPDALFEKPQLQASITIPDDAVTQPIIDASVVDNIEVVLQQELGVDLSVAVVEPKDG